MHRYVRTIMTTIVLTVPLAATPGDDAQRLGMEVIRVMKELDWPPTQELREKVRQWQRSFETLQKTVGKSRGCQARHNGEFGRQKVGWQSLRSA
jgi:hypothetical protein